MSKVISIVDRIEANKAKKAAEAKEIQVSHINNVVDMMAWQLKKMGWSPLEMVGMSKQPEAEKAVIEFSAFFSTIKDDNSAS